MIIPSFQSIPIDHYENGQLWKQEDWVAQEDPLEIQIGTPGNFFPLSITMRTPGQDRELAIGFCLTEGILQSPDDVLSIHETSGDSGDIIYLEIKGGYDPSRFKAERNFYATSSCGVCGKASIDALRQVAPWLMESNSIQVPASLITALPEVLKKAQPIFEKTGGLHASGLFDMHGTLLALFEDVGRHNALDKLIGSCFEQSLCPLHDRILVVSGRASFELVQKAYMAAIPIMIAVGAPSSLAVELARETGMTLCGFTKANKMNIYSGGQRILID